jgi:hypothetical protein
MSVQIRLKIRLVTTPDALVVCLLRHFVFELLP